MLHQANGYPLNPPILKTLLRSLLPFIVRNQQWTRQLTQLSKAKSVYIFKQNKFIKQQNQTQKSCPLCQNFIFNDNLFVLILHLEIQHQISLKSSENDYFVKKYEFTYDGVEIHFLKKINFFEQRKDSLKKSQKLSNSNSQQQPSFKDLLVQTQTITYLTSSFKSRNTLLLERIFSKFCKKIQTISNQRKFYHSYNVYRTISAESDGQNSQEEREQLVQKELERLRINDFNDVSFWDKILFMEWNRLVRAEKKELKILYQSHQIVSVLEKFCVICKKKSIPRINLNMHLYTLWSVGKIKDYDMLKILNFYNLCDENRLPESIQNQ